MKRSYILDNIPDSGNEDFNNEMYDYLVEVINHFESKFEDIRDHLDYASLGNESGIEEAFEIASKCRDGLY